jgi:hypothetical protein
MNMKQRRVLAEVNRFPLERPSRNRTRVMSTSTCCAASIASCASNGSSNTATSWPFAHRTALTLRVKSASSWKITMRAGIRSSPAAQTSR